MSEWMFQLAFNVSFGDWLIDCYFRIYTPFHEDDGITKAEKAGHAFLNALIVIAVVLGMTILLVILYLKKCYKVSMTIIFLYYKM